MPTSIRSRVPAVEYFSLPGTSISHLKEMRHSPQMYAWRLDHQKDSQPLRLGRAAHTAVLEPERFDPDFLKWDQRTPSGKLRPRNGAAWQLFVESANGRTILTKDEYISALSIASVVRSNPAAMRYLEAGDPEVTIQWMIGNRQCRGRVDWLTNVDGRPVIVGLKTTRDCRNYIFGIQAARLGYHMQWAWYKDGYKICTGHSPRVVEIVVEKEAPICAVYAISDDIILQGREEYDRCLERLEECERTGYFPGPQEEEEELVFPAWAYPRGDDDLSDLGLEA